MIFENVKNVVTLFPRVMTALTTWRDSISWLQRAGSEQKGKKVWRATATLVFRPWWAIPSCGSRPNSCIRSMVLNYVNSGIMIWHAVEGRRQSSDDRRVVVSDDRDLSLQGHYGERTWVLRFLATFGTHADRAMNALPKTHRKHSKICFHYENRVVHVL